MFALPRASAIATATSGSEAGQILPRTQQRAQVRRAMLTTITLSSTMPRTGGFRKVRWAAKGRGRRGGAPIVCFYVAHRRMIYRVFAYGKGRKTDLTESERAELKRLAAIIKQGRT